VICYLKEDQHEFLEKRRVKDFVENHSEFIGFPMVLRGKGDLLLEKGINLNSCKSAVSRISWQSIPNSLLPPPPWSLMWKKKEKKKKEKKVICYLKEDQPEFTVKAPSQGFRGKAFRIHWLLIHPSYTGVLNLSFVKIFVIFNCMAQFPLQVCRRVPGYKYTPLVIQFKCY